MARPALPHDLRQLAASIARCTKCPLHLSRSRTVPGEGSAAARIVLIGEAPGRQEDREGRPFVGAAGRILDEALTRSGLSRSSVYITNTVKCRPPRNRHPRGSEIHACRPYLTAQLETIDPLVIVALGQSAVQAILGSSRPLGKIRGRWRLVDGAAVMPTYHPAAILYNRRLFAKLATDFARVRRRVEGS